MPLVLIALFAVTREEIENLHIQFKTLSIGGRIDLETFERCLGPLGQVPNLLTKRLFSMFDQDADGQIDFQELCCGLSVLLKGDNEEKIRCTWRGEMIAPASSHPAV